METEDSIYFYSASKNFGYMSNFYKSKFIDNQGNKFCCSEQYLMYWKAKTFEPENAELLKLILKSTNANKIKALGRSVQNYNDEVWSQIRLKIMINGLRLKFTQNITILGLLLSTDNKTLYEASKHDKIWGIGYYAEQAVLTNSNKFGSNLLGNALMTIRKELMIEQMRVLNKIISNEPNDNT
jgi:ribA/ribD-fused uncharacterized protein